MYIIDKQTIIAPIGLRCDVESSGEFFVQGLGFDTEPSDAIFVFFTKRFVARVGPSFRCLGGVGGEGGGGKVFDTSAATPAFSFEFARGDGEGGEGSGSVEYEVIFVGVGAKGGNGEAKPALCLLQKAQVLDVADAVFAARAEVSLPEKGVGGGVPRL